MTSFGMGRTIRVAASLAALVLGLSFPGGAVATPVVGQQIYYGGGNVTVTVLPYDAAYTSNLYLYSSGGPVLIANSSQVGTVVDLGNLATLYGIHSGDELIFGILVLNTGDSFLMGPGSRNPDGTAHAAVDYAEGSSEDYATLGFEDLFGGGDFDYNDALFLLEGSIGEIIEVRVPEPASLTLLLFGLAAVALRVRSLSGGRRGKVGGSPLE
jgi:hypothetical protein